MQQPYQPYQPQQNPSPSGPPPHVKRPGRARRFFRGYLMVAGAAATLVGITLLIVSLFVEIHEWL